MEKCLPRFLNFDSLKFYPRLVYLQPANKSILLGNISVGLFYKNPCQNTNITHDKAEKLEMLANIILFQEWKTWRTRGSTCSQACWVWREYLSIHISQPAITRLYHWSQAASLDWKQIKQSHESSESGNQNYTTGTTGK